MHVNPETLAMIDENAAVDAIAKLLPRSAFSVNKTHESDSELVDIGLSDRFLAVTTDCISEEITAGLYRDPYLIGWMAVNVNLSDLAAVGATPVGLIFSMTVSPEWDSAFIEQVSHGIADACRAHGCGSLGGDLNTGTPAIGATALGWVDKTHPMTRQGIRDGDFLYTTGPAGLGSAYALDRLFKNDDEPVKVIYQPAARLKEASVISRYASACMDTSDGLIATLDQLYRLNGLSFYLEEVTSLAHPVAVEMARIYGLPVLIFLCTIHGDFELCFSIPEAKNRDFLRDARSHGFAPVYIGRAAGGTPEKNREHGIYIHDRRFSSGKIRNLWPRSTSISDYMTQLDQLMRELIPN